MDQWFCIEIHPKVVELWEISSPPAVPYGMQYCLYKILSTSTITELIESYSMSPNFLKSVMNWWFCIEVHPKVVGLWEIYSPPATVRHAVLPTLQGQYNRAEWELPKGRKFSEIGSKLVVVHGDLSQLGWTVRDMFTASDRTACSIAYIKYFLWALLQSWLRGTQRAQNFWNQLWIRGSALRFIPKWWDFGGDIHGDIQGGKYTEWHTRSDIRRPSAYTNVGCESSTCTPFPPGDRQPTPSAPNLAGIFDVPLPPLGNLQPTLTASTLAVNIWPSPFAPLPQNASSV